MNINIKHYCKVKGGKISFYNQELWRDQLTSLEDKECVLILKKKHEKPSQDQYGYYWGCILVVCHQSEMFSYYENKEMIHDEYFAKRYLSYRKTIQVSANERYDKTFERGLSSLSKEEMSEFMSKVIMDCEMNGIRIPAAEEFYQKYYNKI